MDVAGVSTMIGSLGFPIVCCGGLFWYITKLTSQHAIEMANTTAIINNNTEALNKLIDRLSK